MDTTLARMATKVWQTPPRIVIKYSIWFFLAFIHTYGYWWKPSQLTHRFLWNPCTCMCCCTYCVVLKSNYHIKAWRSCSVLFPSRYRWWYHIVCSYSYHIYEKFLLLFFQFPSWSEWTQKHYTPKVEEINVVFPRIAIRIDKLATTRRTFRARFCDDFCTMNHGLYAFTDPPPSSVSRECSDSSSGKMKAMRLVNTIPNI